MKLMCTHAPDFTGLYVGSNPRLEAVWGTEGASYKHLPSIVLREIMAPKDSMLCEGL